MIGPAACLVLMMALAPLAVGLAQPVHGPGAGERASYLAELVMPKGQVEYVVAGHVFRRLVAEFKAEGMTSEEAENFVHSAIPPMLAAPALQARLRKVALATFHDSDFKVLLAGRPIDPSSDLGLRQKRFAKEVDAALFEASEMAWMDFLSRNAAALTAYGYTLPPGNSP